MASEKSIKYNGCKFCANCFECCFEVCFYDMSKEQQEDLIDKYNEARGIAPAKKKGTYYARNRERILAQQKAKRDEAKKNRPPKEVKKLEGTYYERYKTEVKTEAEKANQERKSEFINSNLEYMERDCNRCINHTSGRCSAWKCEGTLTAERLQKQTVDKFVERVAKHINLGAVSAVDLFKIAEQFKAEV